MLIVTPFLTPAGWLEMEYDEHFIYRALFIEHPIDKPIEAPGQLSALISTQLNAYADNPNHRFQLPLKPLGSTYQQHIWNALLVIPVGRTITYGKLATTLQSSPRAIGQACKKNPLALFIPCHRVVGQKNEGGYMGRANALKYKQALLKHESEVT
jgi:methylated-DNA-[protein]-cysteine S-methyltransferase